MNERVFRLRMKPVPERFAQIFRERGMEVPPLHSGCDVGALIPLNLRNIHKLYAKAMGFFWLPCDLCGREFGGHEITDSIPDPTKGPGWSSCICPFCTIDRNLGSQTATGGPNG
jgi:hypothetical protein